MMVGTELLSLPDSDENQQQTTRTEEMSDNTKQGLVPLVMGPILECLGIFGFPVPDDCQHAETAEISTCSSLQNQDSLQHVHTEDTRLQDTGTLPQDSTVKHAAFSSDHADTSLHLCLYDGQTTGTTEENLVPEITDISDSDFNQDRQQRMNGDFQTVMQNKRNELKEKRTVYPITGGYLKNTLVTDVLSNKPVRIRDPGAGVEKVCEPKQKDHRMGKQLCPKCRRKKTFRNIIFAFIVTLSTANVGRYATVFSDVSGVDTHLVSSVTNMAFTVCSLFIYVASYPALRTHLPRLLQLLQAYEDSYSVRVDCRSLRRKVIHLIAGGFLFQGLIILAIFVGLHTFLPSFKNLLTPFQELEGPGLYVLSFLMSAASLLVLCPFSAIAALSLVGTYLLVTEYQHVTRQLSLLLTSREDSLLEETQPPGSHRQSEQEQPVSGSHDVNTGDHSNRNRNGDSSNDHFRTMTQHGPNSRSSLPHRYPPSNKKMTKSMIFSQKRKVMNSSEKTPPQQASLNTNIDKISSPPPPFVYYSPPANHVQTRAKNGSKQPYPINNTKNNKQCPPKEKIPDEVIDVEDIEETFPSIADSDGNPSTPQTDEEHQLRVRTEACHPQPPEHQARDRLPHRGHTRHASRRVQGHRHGNDGRSEEGEVEEVFDQLCGQHQVLCAILQRFHGCLAHMIAVAFICGIPVFCVMLYGLGSSSVQRDEAGLLGFILAETVMSIVVSTVLGIFLHDHAHGVQEVIYAADWSQFSDRLLTKIQLFASRLGQSQIGYHVYGLFVIDRSTVLMVAGTLVTYTVVVIQFQQSGVSTCPAANSTSALSGTSQ